MQKILYIFVLSFILISCGDTSNNRTNSLSTLIKPSFTYNIDFFRCNLNDNVSLFNLESFFSKNILKYSTLIEFENIKLSVLFPDNESNVKNFLLSITSKGNPAFLKKFIDEINADGIDEIADCSFAIYQNNAFDIIPKETTNSDFNKIEILRCTYNDSYNYGTFKISIDRFVNHIQKLDIPYSLSYVEDKSLKNSFFWINTFYQKQYKDSLLANWVTNRDSIEIKDEFTENATCLDSSVYKSYDLL